jgi:protein TonB
LIGSTIIHLILIISITHMYPPNHGTMHEIEAFILEAPAAQPQKPPPSPPHSSKTDTHRNTLKSPQLQPAHQVGRSAPPRADQKAERKPPSIAPSELSTSQPALSEAPARAGLNTAPINALSTRSQEENSESNSSSSSRQNSGSGPPMVLGDADAPRFIHRELPKYPLSARKFGKEGNVVLRLALDTQGQLEGIEVIEANGFGFAESAQAAIRKSTFAPAFKNGRAISSQVLVPIRFVLHEGQ